MNNICTDNNALLHTEGTRRPVENAHAADVNDNIVDILKNEFYSFDIEQLVDVINEIFDEGGRIFFEAEPSLSFPAGDINSVTINSNEKSAAINLPVMNLLGISSPLPVKFSDYITRNLPDAGFYRDFLSIAQNRLHKLWLDARRKYAFWSDAVEAVRAILESMPVRSASGLSLLIKSTWKGIPVTIEENVERRTAVDNTRPLGGGLCLGHNAAAGTKILDRASKFRVSLGPLDYGTYKTFLPDEGNHQRIREMIISYLNEPLICELEVSCRQADLPRAQTGGALGGRLGRTAALGGEAGEGVCRYRAVVSPNRLI